MTPGSSSLEWAGARGEKWRSQLAGLEATIKPIDVRAGSETERLSHEIIVK